MIDIIVNGAGGRMGSILVGKINESKAYKLAGGVDITGSFGYKRTLAELEFKADIVNFAAQKKLPLIICTTGYQREELKLVKAASEVIPVFMSGNMSVGIAVLIRLARQAALAFPGADIEIIETHHNRKLDAPSGTALMLAEAVKEVRPGSKYVYGRQGSHVREKEEIGIHAIRMGNIVGEHQVIIATDSQTITLKHEAHDRALFAEGALAAAEFLIGKPAGLYNMQDVVAQEKERILV
jgi:4-hydroxy-tetrahydrodipicolinate reductase